MLAERLSRGSRIVALALVASAAAPAQAPRVLGRVLDEHGRPIAGAAVALCGPRWTTADVLARPDARTDAEGHFAIPTARIAGIPDCRGLAIAAPERATAEIRHIKMIPDTEMYTTVDHDVRDVLLPKAVTLRGRVRTLESRPLPDALVSAEGALQKLVPDQESWHRTYVTRATCDAKGTFELVGAVATGAVVRAVAQGYYRETRPFVTAADPLVFELRPSGEVVGRMIDDTGDPVAGTAYLEHGDEMSLEHQVGADGRFRIGIELPGPIVVRGQPLDPLGWAPGKTEAAAPNAEIAVRLPRYAETRVRVREKATGAPIAGASVKLRWLPESWAPFANSDWAEHTPAVLTDAEGEATVRGRSRGESLVGVAIVSKSGFAHARSCEVRKHDDTLEFELQNGARVSGVVRDADSEQPIAGAEVSWIFTGTAEVDWLPGAHLNRHVIESDADGKFTIQELSTDDVSSVALQVRAAGFAAARPKRIGLDGRVEFALSRGFTLRGKVRGLPAGTCASVHAASTTGWPQLTPRVALGDDGSFALPNLRGRYDVYVSIPALAHREGRLDMRLGGIRISADTEQTFEMADRLGHLRGRVRVRGPDVPLDRLAALVEIDSGPPMRQMLDASGRFDLSTPHGSCRVRIVDVATGAFLASRVARHATGAPDHDFDLHLTELRLSIHGKLGGRLRTSIAVFAASPREDEQLDGLFFAGRPLDSPLSLAEGQTEFVAWVPAQPIVAKLYSWHDEEFVVAEAELTPKLGRVNTLDLDLPDK